MSPMRDRSIVVWLATLAAVSSGASIAHGYVRELTSQGVPIAWKNPCFPVHVYLGDPPPVAAKDVLATASAAAVAVWSYPSVSCSDLRLTVVIEDQPTADVGYDRRNVVTFRRDAWCRQPGRLDDAGVEQPDCYPSTALAVTSVFKNAKTGEILDADMELNAVDYSWGDRVALADAASPDTMDFLYAVTHEMGHVIGLDHPCYAPSDRQGRMLDNTGAPEVDCYGNPALPDAIAKSIMYPSVDLTSAKTTQRTLGDDDVQGVCEIYPHVHDFCPTASDGGCQLAQDPDRSTNAALVAFVLLGLLAVAAKLGLKRTGRRL